MTQHLITSFTPDSASGLRAYWLAEYAGLGGPDGCTTDDGLVSIPIVGWALVDGTVHPCVVDLDKALTLPELEESLSTRVSVPATTDPATVAAVKAFLTDVADDDQDDRRRASTTASRAREDRS